MWRSPSPYWNPTAARARRHSRAPRATPGTDVGLTCRRWHRAERCEPSPKHASVEAVLERMANCPDPRLKEIMDVARRPPARVRARRGADVRRVARGHPVPHANRPDLRREAPGVHPALGHARRVDARRRHQSPQAVRRNGVDGARPVPCARTPPSCRWATRSRETRRASRS